VGNEGIVGVSLFMGGNSTPSRAVVQTGGVGYRLTKTNGPTLFGAAIDSNIVTASFKAVLSAVNRRIGQTEAEKTTAADVAASAV